MKFVDEIRKICLRSHLNVFLITPANLKTIEMFKSDLVLEENGVLIPSYPSIRLERQQLQIFKEIALISFFYLQEVVLLLIASFREIKGSKPAKYCFVYYDFIAFMLALISCTQRTRYYREVRKLQWQQSS